MLIVVLATHSLRNVVLIQVDSMIGCLQVNLYSTDIPFATCYNHLQYNAHTFQSNVMLGLWVFFLCKHISTAVIALACNNLQVKIRA